MGKRKGLLESPFQFKARVRELPDSHTQKKPFCSGEIVQVLGGIKDNYNRGHYAGRLK